MNISPSPSPRADAEAATRTTAATNALSAIVFRDVLKPLAAGLGPAGDVVLDRVVDGLFVKPAR
jgi:hypothetical protein